MNDVFEQSKEKREEVRVMYPDVYFPNPILQPLWFGRRPTNKIPSQFAVVDQNSNSVLSIVSDQYKIVRYEDILILVNEITSAIDGYGKIQIVPRSLVGGGRFQIQLKFPEMQKSIKVVDNIIPKLDVFTSLDLSFKLTGRFGAFRLLCTNGMGVWERFRSFAKRHLQTLILDDLHKTIEEGLGGFKEQVIEWKKWSEMRVPLAVYDDTWKRLPFSTHEREKIEVLPELSTKLTLKSALEKKSLTVWDMNSVLTQFATHDVRSEIRKIDLESDIAKAMEMTFKLAANA